MRVSHRRRIVSLPRLACCAALAIPFAPVLAADPGEPVPGNLCCAVPPRDEATADHVFGRWVVTQAGIGAPLREGQRIEFRRNGELDINASSGVCRYSVLRAELTVACAGGTRQGQIEFIDDTKAIWRIEGHAPVTIAPAD